MPKRKASAARTAPCSGSGLVSAAALDGAPRARLHNRVLALTSAPFVIAAVSLRTAWDARKDAG